MRFFIDKRNLVILLLCVLFLIKLPQEDIRFIFWVLGGVFLAASCDIFINRFFLHKKVIPKSAVISGFIVAGILNYKEPFFLLASFCILAVISKHIILYKKGRIFNPANFALFFAAIFGLPLTWNIESNIYLIIIPGLYIAYAIKKLPHVVGFLLFFTAFFKIAGVNPLSLISWFFVFIMLIEPKTSGFGNVRGFIFGSVAGIASFLIFKFFPRYDFFVCSLFIANLFNPILEQIKK